MGNRKQSNSKLSKAAFDEALVSKVNQSEKNSNTSLSFKASIVMGSQDSVEFVKALNDGVPFPIEVFPKLYQDFSTKVSDSLGLPIQFILSGLLPVFSSLLGTHFVFEEKPGIRHSASLWLTFVGYSGVGKTPVIKVLTRPLQELDRRLYEEYKQKVKELEMNSGEDSNFEKPHLIQSIINDFTFESLAEVLINNKKGVFAVQDEVMSLFNGLNKYRKGDDVEKLLSLHSHTPIIINRKSSDHLRIDKPYMSLIGGIQPGVLHNLGKGDHMESGMFFRLLFVDASDFKQKEWNSTGDQNGVIEWYETTILKFNDLIKTKDYNHEKPFVFYLSEDAKVEYKSVMDTLRQIYNNYEGKDVSFIKTLFSKFQSHFGRLCLVLHAIQASVNGDFFQENISAGTVSSAAEITRYLISTSMKASRKIKNSKKRGRKPQHKEIDWDLVFHDKKFMKMEKIIEFVWKQNSAIGSSTIRERASKELKKVSRGVYTRP
ncbi:DUF3987 domain-containing protein [Sediminitomix flava]|uniref:Uncharacterized protein DUF3987 n=1 Tax=Sediminitomix flava TaxID=379075 RepID=A0A315ZAN7_SEDFL|nr:DUF3987 domain-containing protein [Sediminitomix flava]PWJ42656.1 uncharacterized protein DUF3987 [Sediminitomix flava]